MIHITALAAQHDRTDFDCGEPALNDFLRRLARQIGLYAVVVDAKHAEAAAFYAHFGFQHFQDGNLRLFLPLSTIRQVDLAAAHGNKPSP